MRKQLLLVLSLLQLVNTHAMTLQEILSARDEAIHALQAFSPSQSVPGYSDNPKESKFAPNEEEDHLKSSGLASLQVDKDKALVFHQAQSRPKLHYNPKAVALQDADSLITQADKLLEGKCITLPSKQHQPTTHQCDETVTMQTLSCGELLDVQVKTKTDRQQRLVISSGFSMPITLNLSTCDNAVYCNAWELWQPDKQCQQLEIRALQAGHVISITKAPTCQDPSFTIQLNPTNPPGIQGIDVTIKIDQRLTEEHWLTSNCPAPEKLIQNQCYPNATNVCTYPNETRFIDQIALSRPCWGREIVYQCATGLESSCTPWQKQGCTHTNSICTELQEAFCRRFEQTYVCHDNQSPTYQTLCFKTPPCSQGECDTSQSETSHDVQEGLSQLAILLQSAQGAADLGIRHDWEPTLFTGEPLSCQNYVLGIRDCCTDSGWGDWVIHCPKPLQALQRAKQEGRAFYLGAYKHDILSKTHVYCVFPSKLAGILQIQGRYQQLGQNFGKPKTPDCRGLSIKELQAIDFAKLDLSSLMVELQTHLNSLQSESEKIAQNIPNLPPGQIGGRHD